MKFRKLFNHPVSRALSLMAVLALALSVSRPAFAADPASTDMGPNDPDFTWLGTATGGAPATDTSTCTFGVSCDKFTVNVTGTEADWADKVINVAIEWTLPTSDYDLYIYKGDENGTEVGSSGDFVPDTIEESAIVPSSTGVGQYTVVAVYFAVPPGDQYTGSLRIDTPPVFRQATYIEGGIEFSADIPVSVPVAAQDGEPSLRVDACGNTYVGAIRGVPAGVDLWYFDLNPSSPTFDPMMRNPIYRGQPDSFTQDEAFSVGADGGGDIDLAVGFVDPADCDDANPPKLAYSSLVAANISTGNSLDKGENFNLNPLGNVTGGPPGDDRQWHEFHGEETVYLLYRTLAPAVAQVQRSNDGGFSYGPTSVIGTIGQVGSLDVHQATGTVYASGSTGTVCTGTPTAEEEALGLPPQTWSCNIAASDPAGVSQIFFVVKVADDGTENGTAYVTYSNGTDIFLAHSTDKGASWSNPVRVSNGSDTRTSLFPWMETGPTPGSVGVVWFGSSNPTNSDEADWEVFYALSYDADSDNPTFRQVKAGDHFIHGSNISVGGTLGNANRNLIDYFQIGFDPQGAAVIAYTDDHNDFDGHTYVTRQISGPSIFGNNVPAPQEGGNLPAASAFDPSAPEVTDFAQDTATGLLVQVPLDDPLDILAIDYSCEYDETDGLTVVAEMLISDLSAVVPESNYRVNFTANAPYSELSPTGQFTFGLSDRGDQFYIRVTTGADGTQGTTWGTAERISDGSITYTPRGAASSSIDTTAETITFKVPVSELNSVLPVEATPLGEDSVLVGLRGQAFTSGANAKRDLTRGGTQYTLGNCDGNDDDDSDDNNGGGENDAPIIKVTGGGKIDGKNVNFGFKADHAPGGNLNFKDKAANLHLLSDSIDSFVADNAENKVTFTGTGTLKKQNQAVTFLVTVTDNGEPGNADTFQIEISNGYSKVGTLTGGNIQVHR